MLDRFNNPVTFVIAIALAVDAINALLRVLFAKLGWSGAVALVGGAANG